MNTVHDFGVSLIVAGICIWFGYRAGRKIERIENQRDRYIAPKGQLYHLRAYKAGHPSVWDRRDGDSG